MNETLYDSYLKQVTASELHVCRFCVRKKTKMKVLSVDPANGLHLADLFNKITQRHFDKNTDYPDLICTDCEVRLQETAQNISEFQETDTFWRTYFQKQSDLKIENDNFVMETQSDTGNCNELETDEQHISIDVINDGSFIMATDMGDIKIEIAPPLDSSTERIFEEEKLFDDG